MMSSRMLRSLTDRKLVLASQLCWILYIHKIIIFYYPNRENQHHYWCKGIVLTVWIITKISVLICSLDYRATSPNALRQDSLSKGMKWHCKISEDNIFDKINHHSKSKAFIKISSRYTTDRIVWLIKLFTASPHY